MVVTFPEIGKNAIGLLLLSHGRDGESRPLPLRGGARGRAVHVPVAVGQRAEPGAPFNPPDMAATRREP